MGIGIGREIGSGSKSGVGIGTEIGRGIGMGRGIRIRGQCHLNRHSQQLALKSDDFGDTEAYLQV